MLEIHLSMIEEQINMILKIVPLVMKLYLTLFTMATMIDLLSTGHWGPFGRLMKSLVCLSIYLGLICMGEDPKDFGLSGEYGPKEEEFMDALISELKGGKKK